MPIAWYFGRSDSSAVRDGPDIAVRFGRNMLLKNIGGWIQGWKAELR
jgi:hypothetical protein